MIKFIKENWIQICLTIIVAWIVLYIISLFDKSRPFDIVYFVAPIILSPIIYIILKLSSNKIKRKK